MKFIIHSKQLQRQAEDFEKELGERCYIPGRDTPQTHGDEILPNNLEAMLGCEREVYVFWDGGSLGTIFDMGMAYALGKILLPIYYQEGRNWQEYFKSKLNKEIRYEVKF